MAYDWIEDLPENCPPKKATPPNHDTFYRLTNNPPNEEDFFSHRRIFPRQFFNKSECEIRSTSIFSKISSCIKVKRFPRHKNKLVASIILPPESGLIVRDNKKSGHHHWWRSKEFDPVASCKLIDPQSD